MIIHDHDNDDHHDHNEDDDDDPPRKHPTDKFQLSVRFPRLETHQADYPRQMNPTWSACDADNRDANIKQLIMLLIIKALIFCHC